MQEPARDDLALLVVAAGRGLRAGGDLPKQYQLLAGAPLLAWTLRSLGAACPRSPLLCVIHADDGPLYAATVACLSDDIANRLLPAVIGGSSRQQSVRHGLEALARTLPPPRQVLIHDAARPFVTPELAARARAALAAHDACAPGLPVTDAIKQVDHEDRVVGSPDRTALRTMQTPQAFSFQTIIDAHRRVAAADVDDLPDDIAVADFAAVPTFVFAGELGNLKITRPEDFVMAQTRLTEQLTDVRTGQGFDVHAFAPGDHVWLGGIAIPHDRSLSGHSDADVLMHAITDAVLGALADGDIGSHFPPSDPQWKGAASEIFLRHAVERVRARGGVLAHVDATVICEAPKVGPHRDAIRARLAAIMDVAIDRVAVKATTSERLGFTGRSEGIAAMAIATVRLPDSSRDSPGLPS